MDSNDKIRLLKDKANRLPLKPGVYLMKNAKGEIIYVGKAKALKNRVTQYFGSSSAHSAKVIKMVQNVDTFETIICDTEYEALMLENSLIKQHKPKYNIHLKDDKGYHYIKITNERWPKIEAVKNKADDGSEYLGPYYSFYVVDKTVDEANKIFKLPDCSRSFDKPSKPCLNYHIGICSAPCKANIKHKEYIETLNSAVNYIKNGGANENDTLLLRQKMEMASENLDFEYAAKLRDRITAIEKSRQKQKVIISSYQREDIIATALAGEVACVTVFCFVGGHLSDKKQFFLEGARSKEAYYSEFIRQYYNNNDIPPHIAIDADFDDRVLIESWLSELKGKKVEVVVPQRATQKQLVEMCLSNSVQALADKINRKNRETSVLNDLAKLLGLHFVPRRIESYDISNTAGSENVGSMVVFIDGRPAKNLYRKFKIKGFIGQDDFRSLNEIIDRRFNEYLIGEDESFKDLPDLILLDGGKGQISAVLPVLSKYKLDIALFGLIKDAKHRTRAVAGEDKGIEIKANRSVFTFLTSIQDEVHRVAVSYHRQRSRKSALALELTKIEGVGEATAKKLIKTFKSVKKIKSANLDELMAGGISKRVSDNIIKFYSE